MVSKLCSKWDTNFKNKPLYSSTTAIHPYVNKTRNSKCGKVFEKVGIKDRVIADGCETRTKAVSR